jgi:hypothetical protein
MAIEICNVASGVDRDEELGYVVVISADEWANSAGILNIKPIDLAAAERTRILAAIKELKPPHRVKTHGDWARSWREAGEMAMWERVIAAIGGDK